jgi:hypothetical protein
VAGPPRVADRRWRLTHPRGCQPKRQALLKQ